MKLTTERVVRSQIPEWLDRGGELKVVGDWHSHPGGRPVPSRVDLDAYASRLWNDRFATEYVAIVVTYGRPSGPSFAGFVTRRVKEGHYVCEPSRDR